MEEKTTRKQRRLLRQNKIGELENQKIPFKIKLPDNLSSIKKLDRPN